VPVPDHVERSRAVYSESASLYTEVVGTSVSPRFEAAEDRAILGAYVELVAEDGLVLDAGCGTGRVARFLAEAGVAVRGTDVAPGMIREARSAHPDILFETASLTSFPVNDASLAGVVYWYSIITTPPNELGGVWSELDRVLGGTGVVLVAFQAGGGEAIERPKAYGTSTDLSLYWHDVENVCSGLVDASVRVRSVLRRGPVLEAESTDQAFVIAGR